MSMESSQVYNTVLQHTTQPLTPTFFLSSSVLPEPWGRERIEISCLGPECSFLKDQITNIWGFECHKIPITTIRLCHWRVKAIMDHINRWLWFCADLPVYTWVWLHANLSTNECGSIATKLSFIKQRGNSLLTHNNADQGNVCCYVRVFCVYMYIHVWTDHVSVSMRMEDIKYPQSLPALLACYVSHIT